MLTVPNVYFSVDLGIDPMDQIIDLDRPCIDLVWTGLQQGSPQATWISAIASHEEKIWTD